MALTIGNRRHDSREEVLRLRKALAWYGEQARLCRLINREGNEGRRNLAEDGGRRARAALEEEEE